MDATKIEWADITLNFWWGCTKVSPACEHCYAETLSKIFSHGRASWGRDGLRWIRTEAAQAEAKRFNKRAQKAGKQERVFVNSMSDTFEDRRDLDAPRAALWETIASCPSLIFMLLTKRPENVMAMVPEAWRQGFPANVWVGCTVEDQTRAEQRIPVLLTIPAVVRFLSCEPLLEKLDLSPWLWTHEECSRDADPTHSIQWVIVGGESGGRARPMHPDWPRFLRNQCGATGVAFFFKQWGEWIARSQAITGNNTGAAIAIATVKGGVVMRREGNIDETLGRASSTNDADSAIYRIGKIAAGRLLAGVEHNAFPEPQANQRGSQTP